MHHVRAVSIRGIVAGILIGLAGICYSSWVLEFVFASSLDPMRTFLSELDAAHRPHRLVYVTGDVATASCAMIAALTFWLPRPLIDSRWGQVAVAALAIFGAATLADVLSPIECIPNVDPGCAAEPSGILPQLHHVHALTSTVAVFAIFTMMVLAVIAAWREPLWPILKTWGLALLVVSAIATGWMLAADNLHGDFRLGLAQRIQVGAMTLWLMAWGWAIGHTPRPAATLSRDRWSACPRSEAESI